MEKTWDIDCHELLKELEIAEVYRNGHSPDAGVLQMPERGREEYSLDEDEETQ